MLGIVYAQGTSERKIGGCSAVGVKTISNCVQYPGPPRSWCLLRLLNDFAQANFTLGAMITYYELGILRAQWERELERVFLRELFLRTCAMKLTRGFLLTISSLAHH